MSSSAAEAGSIGAVVRGGDVTWPVAGTAHADANVPAPDSIFYVGSIAKQFVAACVALLEREGALALDDPVSASVPDLPAWGSRVTVDHLVHHTGGVRERSRRDPVSRSKAYRAWGNEELLDQLRTVAELDFEPGSRYGYSNRGYLLLAEVVAAASGSSLRAFARDRIFEPLGMRETFFRGPRDPAAGERSPGSLPGSRRDHARGAGAVPRGGRGRTVDHRERPRALGRQLR